MADVRRFDPGQKRDPDGKWGDGIPEFDMEGFDLVSEIEGTFGTLAMGADDSGDVRLAFREGAANRELDLGRDELAELGDILDRLTESRDDLDDDAESGEVYDDDRFGFENAHMEDFPKLIPITVSYGCRCNLLLCGWGCCNRSPGVSLMGAAASIV